MSRSRPFATCDRIPATSANSGIAGTRTRPSPSRPIAAGGPPPDANTRSNSGSLSWAAARKSATTLSTPRRMATSRMSSAAHASICSSVCSPSRERYSVRSADRPVDATAPPDATGSPRLARKRLKYRRATADAGRPAAAKAGSSAGAGSFPVVEQFGQPDTDAAGSTDVGVVRDQIVKRRPRTLSELGDRLAGGTLVRDDGLADPDPYRRTEMEPARAVDCDGDDRDSRPKREVRRALVQRQELRFACVDPPLARDG